MEVRRAAIVAIGSIKAPEAVPALLKAAQDPQTKTEAITALAKTPTLDALDAYVEGLASKDSGARNGSMQAIKSLSAKALPLLEAKAEAGTIPPEAMAALQEIFSVAQPLTVWSYVGPFSMEKPDPFDASKLTKADGEFKDVEGKAVKWKPRHHQRRARDDRPEHRARSRTKA